MGSSSSKKNAKKIIINSEEKTNEIEELEGINLITEKSQSYIC